MIYHHLINYNLENYGRSPRIEILNKEREAKIGDHKLLYLASIKSIEDVGIYTPYRLFSIKEIPDSIYIANLEYADKFLHGFSKEEREYYRKMYRDSIKKISKEEIIEFLKREKVTVDWSETWDTPLTKSVKFHPYFAEFIVIIDDHEDLLKREFTKDWDKLYKLNDW